jgi:hypothetical protein
VQPEWFYKGDGSVVVKPGGSFLSPKFALDGSEEPECVGLYVISDEGVPFRVGYVRHLFAVHRIGAFVWSIASQTAQSVSVSSLSRLIALLCGTEIAGARQ